MYVQFTYLPNHSDEACHRKHMHSAHAEVGRGGGNMSPYSLFHIIAAKTNCRQLENFKKIEKKIEKTRSTRQLVLIARI